MNFEMERSSDNCVWGQKKEDSILILIFLNRNST